MRYENSLKRAVIVGGGPAGISAAQWCVELGLETTLIEAADEIGGQLLHVHNPIKNYLGLQAAKGREIRDNFAAAIQPLEFIRLLRSCVIELARGDLSVKLEGGEVVRGSALILATGVRRRKLGVSGEETFRGKGILESGAKETESVVGKRVLIVGGGDAAIENALMLAEHAARVIVVHRRSQFTARPEFMEAARRNRLIEFITGDIVQEIAGSGRVECVILKNPYTGRSYKIGVDNVLIRIGVEPNSNFVQGKLDLDERGYVLIDSQCRTSFPGIFAAGDLANPVSPTISSAVGQGATAAKAAYDWLAPRNDPSKAAETGSNF